MNHRYSSFALFFIAVLFIVSILVFSSLEQEDLEYLNTTYVPYTGAHSNVDLNDKNLSNLDVLQINGYGDGDILNGHYDLEIGSSYGAIEIGDFEIFQGDITVGSMDLDGTAVFRNENPTGSDIQFLWATESSNIRMAIPRGNIDFATQLARSVMVGGDTAQNFNDNIVNCSAQGYAQIDCDTSGTGADLGIQDDLEVRGETYLNGTLLQGEGSVYWNMSKQYIQFAEFPILTPNSGFGNFGFITGGIFFLPNQAGISNLYFSDGTAPVTSYYNLQFTDSTDAFVVTSSYTNALFNVNMDGLYQGNLNVTEDLNLEQNVSMQNDTFICLNDDCTKYITSNATTLIIKG